jgi:hypothetical protein
VPFLELCHERLGRGRLKFEPMLIRPERIRRYREGPHHRQFPGDPLQPNTTRIRHGPILGDPDAFNWMHSAQQSRARADRVNDARKLTPFRRLKTDPPRDLGLL